MLNSFPELFQMVQFWHATPAGNGAWTDKTEIGRFRAIVMPNKADAFHRTQVAGWIALDTINHDVMYVNDGTPIEAGWFFEHPADGKVHRLVSIINWNRPGGYVAWGTESVQGDDTRKSDKLPVVKGTF